MSKVRMDYFRNDISQYTLKIIDHSFFEAIQATSNPSLNRADDDKIGNEGNNGGQDFTKLSERLAGNLQNAMHKEQVQKEKVTVEQLGFGFSDSEDEEVLFKPV